MQNRLLIEILKARGIEGDAAIQEYTSPKPQLAYDPFLLTGMKEGVDHLLEAIDAGKRIVIYGDYDADGVTSTAVLMKTLRYLTDNLTYYIPSRIDEGYGLHKEAIDRIHQDGGEFIVTVDCGSVSYEETRYAHSLGIGTVVTDHHNVAGQIAEGIVINPKAEGDTYPFKGLAGVGVAYKLALALSRVREIPRSVIADVLELVTIGTIADIMPLVDENRTIVKYGLMRINSGCRNKGLRRLIELVGLDCRTLKASNISFGIAPRINAAGRVGDASLGVKLFLSEDDAEIEKYCRELIESNNMRRSLQDAAYEKCLSIADVEAENGDFLLIEADEVHEGILGIVAGKIKDNKKRPTVIVTPNGDDYKGTGRSTAKIDIFEMLNKYRDMFIRFGGHSAACGFTISGENIELLREHLNEDLLDMSLDDDTIFDDVIEWDAEVTADEIDVELARALEVFEPCGKANEAPVFRLSSVSVYDWKFLKNDTKFAKFRVGRGIDGIDCLLFHDALEYQNMIDNCMAVDIYGTIDVNTWRNISKAQIMVKDIRPAGGSDYHGF